MNSFIQTVRSHLAKPRNLYLLLACFVVLDRLLLLVNFNFKFTGDDDLIFWQGAADYAKGIFHEPYFYGQDYNFMLESFVALPFLAIGMPYYCALPLSSSLISLFPFFLISYIWLKKGYISEALFILFLPLLLPIEYGILNSVTRGFTSGLFFSGFIAFALSSPSKKRSWIIAALSLSLGYIFNPNSLVFTFPAFLYLFLNNYRRFSFYWISITVAIPILLIEFLCKRFYVIHPVYIVHWAWDFRFSLSQIIENLKILDDFFSYTTPILWSFGWSIIIIFIVAGTLIFKKDWKKGVSILSGTALIIASLGVSKVNDHLNTIFFSSARMYLGIPLFTGLAFFWCKDIIKIPDGYLKSGIMIAAVSLFFVKASLQPAVIEHHTRIKNYGAVAIKKIDDLSCDCEKIERLAKANNIDLIIFVPGGKLNGPEMEMLDYGCPLLSRSFPKTILNVFERRTWVYLSERSAMEKNVMIYGSEGDADRIKQLANASLVSEDPKIVVIINNTLKIKSLLKLLNIDFKRTTYKRVGKNLVPDQDVIDGLE